MENEKPVQRQATNRLTVGYSEMVPPRPTQRRRRRPVLGDHKRIGKRFIPPFIAQIGPIQEVHWQTEILPELLWLALLNERHGWQRGAELARQVGVAAHGASGPADGKLFASTGAFYSLDGTQRQAVLAALRSTSALGEIREALLPLGMFYDECPLNFLADPTPPADDPAVMTGFKETLRSMFDRTAKVATCAQANAIYIAFASDKLKVMKGLALANLPAIENYPHDEESRRVASAVRAAINGFLFRGPGQEQDPTEARWRTYFWTRGLELEPCSIAEA